jgi:hypothetical protein
LAGKCPEKTNHNISNTHSSFFLHMHILHHDQKRKQEVAVAADTVASMVDTVAQEDRTTLVPGQQQRVVSVVHLVTMCLTMDTGQLQIRCKHHGRNLYSLWVQTMDKTSAMSYRTRSLSCLLNQSILQKSWQDMPFENRWFAPDTRTY